MMAIRKGNDSCHLGKDDTTKLKSLAPFIYVSIQHIAGMFAEKKTKSVPNNSERF
jgi:hypothetical protein